MTYLFDTSAWLAHFLREPNSQQIQKLLDDDANKILLASVSVTEFSRRISSLRPDGVAQGMVDNYLALFSAIIPIDGKIASEAFALSEQCPRRLPLVDSLIAAAAKTHGAVLVHRDAHMANIPAKLLKQLSLV
ncbi:MAG: PIN domain-containing protein [Verrucomicrobiales bacterium]|jgi:predicted nucleic acid-binding protein|nr:PIN domain-containing protein [Verrucomicrobiales bacterium]